MKLSGEAKVKLWALRCNFISMGNCRLTFKGHRFLPASVWRLIFKVICFFNNRHRTQMIELLKAIKNRTQYPAESAPR